ncbi:MAG: DUF1499 domain-containing protein [Pseudomonadota bacterium]
MMRTGYIERFEFEARGVSNAAIWCQRLAVFCVPYLAIVILGHRFGGIETAQAFWLLGLGAAMLLLALGLGVWGLYRLWTFGDQGGMRSARGLAIALALLAPFVYQGARAFALPQLYDISTDLEDPPQFDSAMDDRAFGMNGESAFDDVQKQLQIESYPRVAARRYPLGMVRVFRAAVELVSERDWTILTGDRSNSETAIDEEGSDLTARPTVGADGLPLNPVLPRFRPTRLDEEASEAVEAFETVQVSPIGRTTSDAAAQDERYIEAIATSLIFGFESDVIIRLIEEESGTLVDMRSNSRFGPHDLGANAAQIEAFLADLDASLQGLAN